jgi:SAM-dependent methyltransferase
VVTKTELPPFQMFGETSDEVWRWLCLEGRESCPFLQDYLPGQTGDSELETRLVGSSGAEMLAEGFRIYALFKGLYEQHVGPLVPSSRVLDFGCGFGRVTRFFLKNIAPENLIGIDQSDDVLAVASDRWNPHYKCESLPPTNFEDQSFDLIYAFSVFSHLSEEVHDQWLDEFERLLKPGGLLALTTFMRQHMIERPPPMDQCLTPTEEWLAAYDRGEFCYEAQPDNRCAFIPERYVRERWSDRFLVRDYFEAPDLGQNVIVCTR